MYENFNFIGSLMFLAASTGNIFLYMFVGFYLQEYKKNMSFGEIAISKIE